jgi:hypothetical protein
MSSRPAPAELRWRIPTSGDPRLLKLGLAQVGLATIVAALVLLVAAPRAWLGPSLAGLVPLALIMAYFRWQKHQRSLAGPDNVRIDDKGLHWLDAAGQERTLARADTLSFHMGRDEDTIRPVPALTLDLAGGFESQPIEIHAPASLEAVRQFLKSHWQLPEKSSAPSSSSTYDRALDIYSECHDEYQEWHWEGTRQALLDFFAQFESAAKQLPLAPPGAKPAQIVIAAQRRQPTRLRIQHLPAPHLEHDTIGGPPDLLAEISRLAAKSLQDASADADFDHKFNLQLGPKDTWTFHLHVRQR